MEVPFADRAVDRVAMWLGSWRVIILANVLVAGWLAVNVVAIYRLHWDPYPFILVNLIFSWEAFNTGPILLRSANLQAQKDRHTLERTYQASETLLEKIDHSTAMILKIAKHLEIELEA